MQQVYLDDPIARAQSLGPTISKAAEEIERTKLIPEVLLSKIHKARLARMLLPKLYGGDELDPGVYLLVLEEISGHDASVGWNLFVANSAALITPFVSSDTVRAIYDDERAIISWGPPDSQRAKVVDGGYILNGRWHFASGCRQATWMGAHCPIEEKDGSLRLNEMETPSITTFLFPIDKVAILDTWDTIGLRGTGSESYEVNDLFVPEAFTGTREQPEKRTINGPLYWFTQQGLYAVGVAAVALGVARAMLKAYMDLAKAKTPRGQSRLADQNSVHSLVAQSEARLSSGKAYLLNVLAEGVASADDYSVMAVSERARLRLATTNAILGSIEVADRIHKAAGVSAIFSGSGPFERRFRDIHTLSQQIQSRDGHFETVGRIMLGEPPSVFY